MITDPVMKENSVEMAMIPLLRLWVNPTPRIEVGIDDTILCDNALITIEVLDGLHTDIQGTSVYDLDVTYTSGAVNELGITVMDEYSDFIDISDLLINNTDSVQIIEYHLTARIRDDRPGHSGEYCNNGTDTTITLYLNPTSTDPISACRRHTLL